MWKFRVARALVATPLVLFGLALPARAGDLFHRPCGGGCSTEVIKVPGNEIVVETARPQVIVNETRVVRPRHVRAHAVAPVAPVAPLMAAPPMVATIFTPMALPVAPAPPLHAVAACPAHAPLSTVAACPPAPPVRGPLSALHEMELAHLEARKLHASLQAEMAHTQDAFNRMSASLQSGLGAPKLAANGDTTQALVAEVQRLNGLVGGLTDKTKELQTLVIAHDEVIKTRVLQPGNGSGCGTADTKRLEDMIKDLQKLVLRHDDVLQNMVRQRIIPPPPPLPGAPAAMPPAAACPPNGH